MSEDLNPDGLGSESMILAIMLMMHKSHVCCSHFKWLLCFVSVDLSTLLCVFLWAERKQMESCRLTVPIVGVPSAGPTALLGCHPSPSSASHELCGLGPSIPTSCQTKTEAGGKPGPLHFSESVNYTR